MPKEKHWSEVSKNPISEAARSLVTGVLKKKDGGSIHDLTAFWEKALTNRTLLDIGVVEHSMEFTTRPGWRHGIFVKLASRAVGVDILVEEVKELNKLGYDVRVCDATSDADLNERFDVVYIGDVIEHVNDPVGLIRFAGRHARPDGEIIVSTPSPFWWRNVQEMISRNTYIGNVDHVRWVTPVNALEIAHRAGVSLKRYYTVETEGNNIIRKYAMRAIKRLLGRTELFTWAYVYVFAPGAES
ncbi:MAG: methyltransferase domain-containing protein [Mesorhizobium sp.]|nr:MAG: methyltransferase domain-containing protein [Mesorhizobium sp.]